MPDDPQLVGRVRPSLRAFRNMRVPKNTRPLAGEPGDNTAKPQLHGVALPKPIKRPVGKES